MDNSKVDISRQINIYWKENRGGFYMANKNQIMLEPRPLGSSTSAVNKMLARGEEQKEIMSEIIGVSTNAPNWQAKIEDYWHSLSVSVPHAGKDLEVGFSYEYGTTNELRRSYIDNLDKTKVKDSTSLANYVEANVPEHEKYRYGHPINPVDYMLYRYCLVYSYVANTIEDIDKSAKIKFYLFSKAEKDNLRKESQKLKEVMMGKYLEAIKDENYVIDLMYILGKGLLAEKGDIGNCKAELLNYAETKPKEFIKLVEDKNIKLKGYIERLIDKGVLKRLTNTSIILDGTESDIIIGNNMDEAITFFANQERNKQKINEYKTRYNGLKTKK